MHVAGDSGELRSDSELQARRQIGRGRPRPVLLIRRAYSTADDEGEDGFGARCWSCKGEIGLGQDQVDLVIEQCWIRPCEELASFTLFSKDLAATHIDLQQRW